MVVNTIYDFSILKEKEHGRPVFLFETFISTDCFRSVSEAYFIFPINRRIDLLVTGSI